MTLLIVLVSVLALAMGGCSLLPCGVSQNPPAGADNLTAHARKMQTPLYSGKHGAIIYSLDHVEDDRLTGAIDRIIRLFAENEVPLDIAVQPDAIAKHPDLMSYFRECEDAGIVDISVDGNEVNWVDIDSPVVQNASADLKSQLSMQRAETSAYFGGQLATCVFPYESLNEYNYRVLQDAGFKILRTPNPEGFVSSRQLVDWHAALDPRGLCRFPIVGSVNYGGLSDFQDVDTQILSAVGKSLDSVGIAVIEIDPTYFLDGNSKVDASRVRQLGSQIKSVKSLGETGRLCDYRHEINGSFKLYLAGLLLT
jgi:hypothetical protein